MQPEFRSRSWIVWPLQVNFFYCIFLWLAPSWNYPKHASIANPIWFLIPYYSNLAQIYCINTTQLLQAYHWLYHIILFLFYSIKLINKENEPHLKLFFWIFPASGCSNSNAQWKQTFMFLYIIEGQGSDCNLWQLHYCCLFCLNLFWAYKTTFKIIYIKTNTIISQIYDCKKSHLQSCISPVTSYLSSLSAYKFW